MDSSIPNDVMSTTNGGPNIITNGLVFYLDAANSISYISGSTRWNDISQTRTSGSLINGPSFNSSNGGAIVFDGSNDYASFPNNTNLDNQKLTMENWVYPTITLSQQGFIFEKGLINSQYSSFFESDGNFYFRTRGLSPQDLSIVSANFITLNNWNHIVCTYESGTKTIYVNGVQVAQVTGVTGTIFTNTIGIFLGAYYNNGPIGYPLKGRIAISKVYSRGLTLTEVKQNFNATKTRFGL
jgi:hypothetical protein